MIKLRVDGREIEADEKISLLQACLDNGIYIPNLCHLKDLPQPHASCRLCFVEVDGQDQPVPSCTVRVQPGLEVRTGTPAVRRLQRASLQLLLSVHHVDCARCPANKKCDLQNAAKLLKVGLKSKRLDLLLKTPEIVQDHPCLDYYQNRCVLCGKCVHVCRSRNGKTLLAFAGRGFDTTISFYGEEEGSALPCEECLACAEICPVSALLLRSGA
jgi:NADH dehydrogenase/NADH:ubiquinone oxidoreductase subunit G